MSSSSFAVIDDSSKTDENVPLTESYEYFDENLDDNGDDSYPSFSDDFTNKPHISKKNQWDNAPRLINNKRKHFKKNCPLLKRNKFV